MITLRMRLLKNLEYLTYFDSHIRWAIPWELHELEIHGIHFRKDRLIFFRYRVICLAWDFQVESYALQKVITEKSIIFKKNWNLISLGHILQISWAPHTWTTIVWRVVAFPSKSGSLMGSGPSLTEVMASRNRLLKNLKYLIHFSSFILWAISWELHELQILGLHLCKD